MAAPILSWFGSESFPASPELVQISFLSVTPEWPGQARRIPHSAGRAKGLQCLHGPMKTFYFLLKLERKINF